MKSTFETFGTAYSNQNILRTSRRCSRDPVASQPDHTRGVWKPDTPGVKMPDYFSTTLDIILDFIT
ncbi:MAG: hypothetical protein GY702_11195 [Desulfobulbaceae bacterium]|nr:hypothetical protein [Desulfobulbaceae bacterium]